MRTSCGHRRRQCDSGGHRLRKCDSCDRGGWYSGGMYSRGLFDGGMYSGGLYGGGMHGGGLYGGGLRVRLVLSKSGHRDCDPNSPQPHWLRPATAAWQKWDPSAR